MPSFVFAPLPDTHLGVPDYGLSIALSGTSAYVLTRDYILIYDTRTLSAPVVLGRPWTIGPGGTMMASGRFLYAVSSYAEILNIFDIGTPSSPTLPLLHWLLAEIISYGSALEQQLAVSGNHVYVVGAFPGFLDIFQLPPGYY
jgi:hypothetical protein